MEEPLRIGILQYIAGKSPEESRRELRARVREIHESPDLLLLPEYSDLNVSRVGLGEAREAARPLDDNVFIEELERLASRGTLVVAGVLEKDSDCLYSTVVAVTPKGSVYTIYRKRVLFDALGYRESRLLCRGELEPSLFSYHGADIAVLVCFELRFPEIARSLAQAGAELILVPTAWYPGPGKEEQLRFLAQARASENTVYLAVADQAAPVFAGRSMVVDPYGHVMLDLGPWTAYGEALIDPARLAGARKALPLLSLAGVAAEAASRGTRRLVLQER